MTMNQYTLLAMICGALMLAATPDAQAGGRDRDSFSFGIGYNDYTDSGYINFGYSSGGGRHHHGSWSGGNYGYYGRPTHNYSHYRPPYAYRPAPVYYAPAPVYYRPAPVYYRPAPVYYHSSTWYGSGCAW